MSVTTQPAVAFGTPVNLPAKVTGNRLSGEPRAYDILADGRFVGLVSGSETQAAEDATALQIRVVLNWFTELQQRVPTR